MNKFSEFVFLLKLILDFYIFEILKYVILYVLWLF